MSTPRERFWSKVDKTDGCWHWTSAVAGKYGRFQLGQRGSKIVQAHRFAYEDVVAPIPPGMTIDHLCLNKLCVNPAHLEVVTSAENNARRNRAQTKTHCIRGHELPPADGRYRGCRVCARLRRLSRSPKRPGINREGTEASER